MFEALGDAPALAFIGLPLELTVRKIGHERVGGAISSVNLIEDLLEIGGEDCGVRRAHSFDLTGTRG
jgi:hypothetical protein